MRITLTILVVLAFAPMVCHAQTKIPIYMSTSPGENDPSGRQLIFEIKEAIQASQSFRLIETRKDWPYIKYSISTLPIAGKGTAAAFVLSYDSVSTPMRGTYISSGVLTCPAVKIIECARETLPDMDEAVRLLQRDAPDLWKTLR